MPKLPQDLELFKKLQEENSTEFLNIIFLKYHDILLTFAIRYLNKVDAEEVVSDIFFLLWQKRKQIHLKTSLKGYLLSTTRNKCINTIKRQHVLLEDIAKIDYTIIANTPIRPDQSIEYEEIKKLLDFFIEKLPSKCKLIFKLNRENNLSYKEISNELDISINTVNTQMYRALKFLKEKIIFDTV
ncbi:RNA polymerase sigma-70 factor [Flavivirga abyssicola]|uniref:RNA polymerase sigma-70 factor n=1 Tax=Flavivirga abyssicola TaxID=3063533 RepID=UPI0026E0D3FF|nr:RNA polymerase sigma-70 factor [Flavivirga sp. MEBiC07777]WVK14947.1 RNA polymerase sigma-70 factor [Flavivirga sp. MEBiC07777]